jgi:hypothetical protein
MHHRLGISTTQCFRFGIAALGLFACSSEDSSDPGGGNPPLTTGGTNTGGSATTGGVAAPTGGVKSTGGTNTGGSPSTGGVAPTGGAATGGAAAGGAAPTGGASTGGAVSMGGSGGTTSGGNNGKGGGGASAGMGGKAGGGMSGMAGAATGGGSGGGGAGGPTYGTFGERKLGYLGCSMSQNVAQGYATLGGKVLWPVMGAYGAQVVQNWAKDGGPWTAGGGFDSGVQQYGQPEAVWIMLCIFGSASVNINEAKQIIALTKQHAPNAKLFITGQPLNSGTDCNLAGNGGAQHTDDIAKQAAMEDSTVTYAGTFGPLTPGQRSDGCHANASGMEVLGKQVAEKWGQ